MMNYPQPREIPQGKVLIAEARDVNETNRACSQIIAKAWAPKVRTEARLIWSSPGFEPAGSCCRWTNGYWKVNFLLDGAYHGNRYSPDADGEAKAREHFARLTAEPAPEPAPADAYTARISARNGKALYLSPAYSTREEAIADAFAARPRARDCSTARNRWFDIRHHVRGGGR